MKNENAIKLGKQITFLLFIFAIGSITGALLAYYGNAYNQQFLIIPNNNITGIDECSAYCDWLEYAGGIIYQNKTYMPKYNKFGCTYVCLALLADKKITIEQLRGI